MKDYDGKQELDISLGKGGNASASKQSGTNLEGTDTLCNHTNPSIYHNEKRKVVERTNGTNTSKAKKTEKRTRLKQRSR